MGLPISAQVVDGTSERIICITKVYGRLVLRSIRVDRVAMAKAVSIVVTDDRLPLLGLTHLQLRRILDNSLATSPIRAANTSLIGNKIDQPSPIRRVRVRHFTFPTVQLCQREGFLSPFVSTRGDLNKESL